VEFYDWLLFLHVGAAFALVAAMVAYWAAILATGDGDHPVVSVVQRPAGILIVLGSLLTLVLGIWLALDNDTFEIWDGWIIASIVLWAIGVGTGQRSGMLLSRPGADGATDASSTRQQGVALHSVSSAAILLVLILMIFKPGA